MTATDIGNDTILKAVKTHKKYTLSDLVSQCKSAKLSVGDKEWLKMQDIGKEVIG